MQFLQDDSKKIPIKSDLMIDNVEDGVQLSNNLIQYPQTNRTFNYSRIYLSNIANACAREEAIGTLLKLKKSSRLFHANVHMMNFGTAFHYWVQNNPDMFFEKDTFLGYWDCTACGYERRFGIKPTSRCEQCGALPGATVYREYHFRLDYPYRVSGKVDGILEVSPGVYRFLDIKTDGAKEDKVTATGNDISQVASYMYFHQFDKGKYKLPIEIDQRVGYVLYFKKLMNAKAPHKTFKVQPTDRLLDPLIKKAELLGTAVKTGELPEPAEICVTNRWTNTRAKNCSRGKECKHYHEKGFTFIK